MNFAAWTFAWAHLAQRRSFVPSKKPTSTLAAAKETIMSKSEIYRIRDQVHGAMTNANNSKTPYSLLIRMEWKKYGHIPVSARFI
jgi:hypothetical protein